MCVVAFAWNAHPRWRLLLAGNRDEFHARPTASLAWWPDDAGIAGGRDLEAIYKHMAEDGLVGWAWDPGAGRTPAPGSQDVLGQLTRAWIDTGAACPG